MAVTTLKGHVSRALDFYNKDNIFMGVGKVTPWSDDYTPPVPDPTDDLLEPAGYKEVESKFLVVPDPEGELTYRRTKWKIVKPEDALEQGARWVFLSTFLTYEELPTDISYRQIGAFTGLIRDEKVPAGKVSLLPTEVSDQGILEVLDNRTPIYREADQREQLVLIIEF